MFIYKVILYIIYAFECLPDFWVWGLVCLFLLGGESLQGGPSGLGLGLKVVGSLCKQML